MFATTLIKALLEPFQLLLGIIPGVNRIVSRRDHFAPHANVPFEGYYTRIITKEGTTILCIFSSVWNAKDKPHFVHFSLTNPPRNENNTTMQKRQQTDILIDRFPVIEDLLLERDPATGVQSFERVASGDGMRGYCRVNRHSQSYKISSEGIDGMFDVEINIVGKKPWIRGDELSTPEGVFSVLDTLLPIHWDVRSTSSLQAEYVVRRNGSVIAEGAGVAHVEKNWGVSFPAGWTWIQGFSDDRETTVAIAGGKIIGQKAYLAGYRSPKIDVSFRPLFTLMPFGFSTPFIFEEFDSKKGTIHLDLSSLTKKLVIRASAPPDHDGWLGLHCPLSTGHGNTYAYESFEGKLDVKVYSRNWYGAWRLVDHSILRDAAVEFGGEYSFKATKTL